MQKQSIGRNKHKLIGIRPDESDQRILAAIQSRHGLTATNAIRLAIRTQGQIDGIPGCDPTSFQPPKIGNAEHFRKIKPAKTPGKTSILKKIRKSPNQ